MKLKGKQIFVLEDDLINRAVMATVLENEGATVVSDYWGDESLEKLLSHSEKIDLFLLDLMLPNGRSGYDIADRIRQEEMYRETPIIIVSASDPDKEIPVVKERGFDGFISKPINGIEFPFLLLDVLEGKTVWQ